jgi:hypothetical protein
LVAGLRIAGDSSTFADMLPWLMALTICAMLLGVAVLFFSITRILRLLRESELARLPAASEAEVTFNHAGTCVLHVEQPRFSMALVHADFALHDAMAGSEVRSWPVIFRTMTSGFSRASVSIRQFEIGHPGVYRFMVSGIEPARDLSKVEFIFTRPYAGKLVLLIVVTVLGGACLIGGLVFTALQYTGKL